MPIASGEAQPLEGYSIADFNGNLARLWAQQFPRRKDDS
jgi:hypothetical protein